MWNKPELDHRPLTENTYCQGPVRWGMAVTLVLVFLLLFPTITKAQELEPRAYLILPAGTNFLMAGYARSSGNVIFDPSLPVEDVEAGVNSTFLGYLRAFDLFGRSASVGVVTPYVWGDVTGKLSGEAAGITRSGLGDSRVRFAVNLYGGPALNPREFANYQQKTNIGFSLVVAAPVGQYDPEKLINLGANRWSFKPEIGVSRAWKKWIVDVYAGGWFFTKNDQYQIHSTREQELIGTLQGHVSYNFRPGLWAAADTTFFTGGKTTVDGLNRHDFQRNSRIGLTLSVPLAPRHSVRFGTSTGAFTRIGADFTVFSIVYQFVWF